MTGRAAITAAAISSFHCTRYSPTMLAMPTDSTYIDESVVSTNAHTYEFHAMRNVNSATATRPGRASGMITRQNACWYDAPSIIAASSMSRGIERKKPISIHTENGSANDE